MLLDNIDSIFARLSSNVDKYVNQYEKYFFDGADKPHFAHVRLPKPAKQVKPSTEKTQRLLEHCKLSLYELSLMESLSKKNKGALTAGEWFMLRTEGIYLLTESAGVETLMDAFIPAFSEQIDMTYGLPKRMSMFAAKALDDAELAKPEGQQRGTRTLYTLERLYELPFDQVPSGPGYAYLWRAIIGWGKRDQMRFDWYMTIDADGAIHNCITPKTQSALIHTRKDGVIVIPGHGFTKYEKWIEERDGVVQLVPVARIIQQMVTIWQSRFFFPTLTVSAPGGQTVVTSITEDEIGTILKNRNAVNGKRRSMMHWVRSHQRSTGSAVRTHLRGDTQCSVDDYSINVLMPGDKSFAPSKVAEKKMDVLQSDLDLTVKIESTTSNRVLARLFANAGVKYEKKTEREADWIKQIKKPISLKSVETIKGSCPVTETYYNG